MWAQQEQRSPGRIVSGAGSLKSPDKFEEPWQEWRDNFSPRPRQRACQDPLTRQGGDALTDNHMLITGHWWHLFCLVCKKRYIDLKMGQKCGDQHLMLSLQGLITSQF
jgi:hypothetical protein